jgi:ferredoxin-fold anticodon binding domain-containing protein
MKGGRSRVLRNRMLHSATVHAGVSKSHQSCQAILRRSGARHQQHRTAKYFSLPLLELSRWRG